MFAPIAQLVEQLPLKEMVVGSTPTGRTKCVTKKYAQCRGGEMVDTPVLGTGPARGGGSSPLLGTKRVWFSGRMRPSQG